MAKNFFNRYVWLIDQIYRHGHITREELNRAWRHSSLNENKEEEIPERTFYNHKTAIEETFGLEIKCDRSLGYYIENADEVNGDDLTKWMLNLLSVRNLVSESVSVRDRIITEDVPSGNVWLSEISRAMTESSVLSMTYQSFYRPEPHTVEIEPWCLKLFRQRWYLYGYSLNYSNTRIYALDRIISLKVLNKKFQLPEDFSASAVFDDIMGVSVSAKEHTKAQKIRVKVSAGQSKYFRTLPLHHSQQEVEHQEDYSVFEYWLVPTFEFRQELLSQGSAVEVLEPASFRSEMANEAAAMLARYQ